VIPSGRGSELILVGTTVDEHRFMKHFGVARA
jgi:hypothetical protein